MTRPDGLRAASRPPYHLNMSRAAVFVAPLLTLALVSCGSDSESGTSGPSATANVIDIRGTIREIAAPVPDVSPGGLAIEGEAEADTRYAKAWVRMKETTVITRRRGGDTVPAVWADLQPGTRVEVKFAGVVAQLDPVQAAAAEITIID
jgi:hypothetical protein